MGIFIASIWFLGKGNWIGYSVSLNVKPKTLNYDIEATAASTVLCPPLLKFLPA